MQTTGTWELCLADDALELPGWLFLPVGLSSDDREQWLADVLPDIVGTPGWDGEPVTEPFARELLTLALDRRAASDSLAMFQVWPAVGYDTVMCHVDILASDGLPDWSHTDAVVHNVVAPHIGPGIQCSTRRIVSVDEEMEVELTSLHFIFDNGEVTLLLSLDEAPAPMISLATPAFVLLMSNLGMLWSGDGTTFEAIAPTGVVDGGAWPFEESE